MEYPLFTKEVKRIVGNTEFRRHGHLLSGIHIAFHSRCLHTLHLGFALDETIDHINKGGKLPEKNYNRYINYFHINRNMVYSMTS